MDQRRATHSFVFKKFFWNHRKKSSYWTLLISKSKSRGINVVEISLNGSGSWLNVCLKYHRYSFSYIFQDISVWHLSHFINLPNCFKISYEIVFSDYSNTYWHFLITISQLATSPADQQREPIKLMVINSTKPLQK